MNFRYFVRRCISGELSITGERVDAVEWVTVLPEIVQVRQVMFGEHRENGEFKENALGEKDCSWSDRRSNFRFLVDGCGHVILRNLCSLERMLMRLSRTLSVISIISIFPRVHVGMSCD